MTNTKGNSIFTRKPSVSWGRQLAGALVGAGLAWLLAPVGQKLGLYTTYALDQVMGWGAFLGAMVFSFSGLVRAGAQVTGRRDARATWLNLAVTLGLMLVLLLIAALLVWAFAALFRLFSL